MENIRWWMPALGVTLLMGSVACGSSQTESESVDATPGYVGAVEGTDAFISILVGDSDTEADEAVVYVCDGDAELSEWFQGEIDDPADFELASDSGATLTAKLVDGVFVGEFIAAGGASHAFTTVEATGDAGLYRVYGDEAEAQGLWAAWVIDNEGDERGAIRLSGSFLSTASFTKSTFTLRGTSFPINQVTEMNGIICT